jgi:hypothetical protein
MKKEMAILLIIGFILSASKSISAQQKPIIKSPKDTTAVKIKVLPKQIHKQKEQMRRGENQEPQSLKPEYWRDDRPLLMKEKDSLQTKAK